MLYGRVCDLKFLATHLDSYNLSTPSITGICSSICIYRLYICCMYIVSIKLSCIFRLTHIIFLLARYVQRFISLLIVCIHICMQISVKIQIFITLSNFGVVFCVFCFFFLFVFFYLSGLHSYQFECGFRLYKIKVENLCVLLYKYKKIINRLKYLDFACLFVCFFVVVTFLVP